ncbi:MAG: hypothetical protein U9N62_02535 [Thermotogota bacterium]|nr:hypothetical protein [Thermotogota bacterium]
METIETTPRDIMILVDFDNFKTINADELLYEMKKMKKVDECDINDEVKGD